MASPGHDRPPGPRVAVVAAMPMELREVVKRLGVTRAATNGWFTRDRGPAAFAVGVGARAGPGTAEVLDRAGPQRVIHVGFCGGLVDGLRPGSIVRAGRVIDAESGRVVELNDGASTVVTVSTPACTPEDKRGLAERWQAAAVDMESYHVAAACVTRGVRCDVVRAVTDPVDEAVDPAVPTLVGDDGEARVGRAVALLARRPMMLGPLRRLARRGRAAAAALGDAVIEELGHDG